MANDMLDLSFCRSPEGKRPIRVAGEGFYGLIRLFSRQADSIRQGFNGCTKEDLTILQTGGEKDL